MGYLANFIVYTLAMIGVIAITLLVFKNSTGFGAKNGSKYLKVHDSLSLGPRKTLYIVSAGQEKFLIAGDVDKTNLISKLEETKNAENFDNSYKNTVETISKSNTYIDKSSIGIYSTQEKPYSSVMKNLAERIKS